jgi:hypothetical protein
MMVREEKTEAAIHSIPSELVQTIKHRVEQVRACVDQRKQGLRKDLTKKTDETQVDLQLVLMSIYSCTGSFKDDITDTKNDCHES